MVGPMPKSLKPPMMTSGRCSCTGLLRICAIASRAAGGVRLNDGFTGPDAQPIASNAIKLAIFSLTCVCIDSSRRSSLIRRFDPQIFDLLVQRIAIDPQEVSGLRLDTV